MAITDQEVDLGEGGRRQIEIVLTDRLTHVRGRTADRDGRAAAGVSVVIFPDDPARWDESRRLVREARSSRDGRFEFIALPPAEYLVVAVEALPSNAWMDPDVLDRLRPHATRFRLDEGEQQVISLTLSPTPDGLIPTY